MNEEIENNICEYERKKRQIAVYEKQINDLKLKLERQIQVLEDQTIREIEPINNQIDVFKQDLNEFVLDHKVLIKLGDIIDEIANITKDKPENICVSGYHTPICYPLPVHYNTIEELIKFITENADPVTLCISIEGKYNSNSYNLQLSFEYDLTNIWADGQTLIKHSKIRAHHIKEFNSNRILTSIVLLKDEGIENLICPLNIEQIANFKNEYNTNLLARAIINCLNKNKNYENPKQKKLQKKR